MKTMILDLSLVQEYFLSLTSIKMQIIFNGLQNKYNGGIDE
jgi:hypothetical protein